MGYFTPYFTAYFGQQEAASGGGGGHRRDKPPGFGSYADQLMRQQLQAERNLPPPRPKWVRHYR